MKFIIARRDWIKSTVYGLSGCDFLILSSSLVISSALVTDFVLRDCRFLLNPSTSDDPSDLAGLASCSKLIVLVVVVILELISKTGRTKAVAGESRDRTRGNQTNLQWIRADEKWVIRNMGSQSCIKCKYLMLKRIQIDRERLSYDLTTLELTILDTTSGSNKKRIWRLEGL